MLARRRGSSRALVFVLVALIAYVYVAHAMRFSQDYTVVQTWMRHTGPSTLSTMHPVVIMDRIAEDRDDVLASTLFRCAYVSAHRKIARDDRKIHVTTAKFCEIFNPSTTAPLHVNLINPRFARHIVARAPQRCFAFCEKRSPYTAVPRGVQYIEVVLHPRQTLVLPTWWLWQLASGGVGPRVTHYHDPISWLVAAPLAMCS
jgi:hypothetical protein